MIRTRLFAQLPAVFVAFLLLAALASCTSSKAAPKPPAWADLGNPKAVFVGKPLGSLAAVAMAPSASGVASTGGTQLIKVNQDGTLQGVSFTDEDGNPVAVEVTSLQSLSQDYLAVELMNGNDLAYKFALLRIPDGKLFDISGMAPDSAQIKGSYLFAVGASDAGGERDVMYEVELSSMRARPMNNPTYDPISPPFDVDHQGNVRTLFRSGNGGEKILFHDNSPPVVDTWDSWEALPIPFCETGGPGATLAKVDGEDDHLYVVCLGGHPDPGGLTTTTYQDYFVREVSFTSAGTQVSDQAPARSTMCTGPYPGAIVCPESKLTVSTPYRIHDRSRYLPLTSGFFVTSAVPAGGITLAWTDKALPPITLISGDYGYWRSGDIVSRIRFTADAVAEVVVNTPNLIDYKVAGGSVVFTKYLTGTNIGTYRVTALGATPELLLSDDMQVQQIVELH
jgi:hypothetical protein